MGALAEDISMTVHPHPTLNETLFGGRGCAVRARDGYLPVNGSRKKGGLRGRPFLFEGKMADLKRARPGNTAGDFFVDETCTRRRLRWHPATGEG